LDTRPVLNRYCKSTFAFTLRAPSQRCASMLMVTLIPRPRSVIYGDLKLIEIWRSAIFSKVHITTDRLSPPNRPQIGVLFNILQDVPRVKDCLSPGRSYGNDGLWKDKKRYHALYYYWHMRVQTLMNGTPSDPFSCLGSVTPVGIGRKPAQSFCSGALFSLTEITTFMSFSALSPVTRTLSHKAIRILLRG
jgi:hypothetical protein